MKDDDSLIRPVLSAFLASSRACLLVRAPPRATTTHSPPRWTLISQVQATGAGVPDEGLPDEGLVDPAAAGRISY